MNPQGTQTPIGEDIDRVARMIVDAAFCVHSSLGPGLLESVYKICLAHEFARREIHFERQCTLPILYNELRLEAGLRLDFVVEDSVVVEQLLPLHKAQLLTYLKLYGHRLGLLINFNSVLIKDGIKRLAL